MALETSKIVLPKSVATYVTQKVKDASTIAALSPSTPQIFADSENMVFNGASEAEVVEEGKASGSYEQTLAPVTAKRFKVTTTTRVTEELTYADEDDALEIVNSIQLDQAAALGRALDYVVYHAINPKSGEVLSGYEALSSTAQKVYLGKGAAEATDKEIVPAIDDLSDAVSDKYDVNGIAMAKSYAGRLRRVRVGTTLARLYPDIPINLQVGSFEGIPASASGTVSGRLAKTATNVLAFLGDFSLIKWGMVRDITAEIIPYGDPDGAGDLKHTHQIAYRTTGTYGYTVLDPAAFAVLLGTAKPTE